MHIALDVRVNWKNFSVSVVETAFSCGSWPVSTSDGLALRDGPDKASYRVSVGVIAASLCCLGRSVRPNSVNFNT